MIAAMLQSPYFLYRSELGRRVETATSSRLSVGIAIVVFVLTDVPTMNYLPVLEAVHSIE